MLLFLPLVTGVFKTEIPSLNDNHQHNGFLSQSQLTLLFWLALGSMLIDHTAYTFLGWAHWLRLPGRAAFPLFCFLIAYNVFYNTRSRQRYLTRLFIAYLVSQPCFFYLFNSTPADNLAIADTLSQLLWSYLTHPNIMLTLLAGGLLTHVYDQYHSSASGTQKLAWLVASGAILLPFLNPGWDYMLFGPVLILMLYSLLKNRNSVLLIPILLITYALNLFFATSLAAYEHDLDFSPSWLCLAGVIGLVAPISIVFLLKRISLPRIPKVVSYGFYPAHMALLAVMR